jgi:hypothetical protein
MQSELFEADAHKKVGTSALIDIEIWGPLTDQAAEQCETRMRKNFL